MSKHSLNVRYSCVQRIHVFYPAEYFEPHVSTTKDRTELSPNCDETATSLLNVFLF